MDQKYLTWCSYLILLSRQGKVVRLPSHSWVLGRMLKAVNRGSRSGSQHCHQRRRQRLSRMSPNLCWHGGRGCVISWSTKVGSLACCPCNLLTEFFGRFEDSLSTICLPLLYRWLCFDRQWAYHPRNRSPICRADGQVLWQCVRGRQKLQQKYNQTLTSL